MTTVKNHIVNLDNYRAHPANYNRHSDAQIAKLQASLSKFGQVRSIVVWREYIIAGHGLTEAAKRLGWKTLRADVLDSAISESVALAYLVADNELARQSDPDQAALAAILDQVKQADAELLTAAGFSEQELAELLASLEPMGAKKETNDPGEQTDKLSELQSKWSTEVGQTWKLGRHTLFVGDSTGVLPVTQTAIIDPEWHSAAWASIEHYDNALVFFDNNHVGDVIKRYGAPRWVFSWDCATTWYVSGKPLLQAKFCAWYGNGKYVQDGWRYGESSFKKGRHTNGRGDAYEYDPHEDGRMLSDIFKRAIVAEHKETDNNHSKPLDWVTALIANCTFGDVADPYAGSGTSIIACEQLGRNCYSAEILPNMAAAIIERCQLAGISPINCAE